MSNVASLELSQRLYEVSGWDDDLVYTNPPHYCPAYTLGYLIRKLPPCAIFKSADGWYRAQWVSEQKLKAATKEDTPEDAAAKLCLELFDQGILHKGGEKS